MIDSLLGEPRRRGRTDPRRFAVDGLIVDDRWVWLLLGTDEIDTVEMLFGDRGFAASEEPHLGADTVMCRRVEGDCVVLARPDREHDRLLSHWLAEEDPDHV